MPGNIVNLTPETMASWPPPNYDNPPERKWLPIACGILYGFSTLMICLRYWLRLKKHAGMFGIDDLMLSFAWLGSTAYTICSFLAGLRYLIGRHTWDIPIPYFEKIALMAWLGEFLFLWTGGFTKISVLLFYRRIVAGTYDKKWKWAIIAAIIFTASWTFAVLITLILNCIPTEAYWKSFNPLYKADYTCVDTTSVNIITGVFTVTSDLYAVVLPFLVTRKLQISRQHKIAMNMLFSSGLLVVAVSCVRTYYLWRVVHDSDVSSMIFDVYFWAQLELQLSIILACLPALRAFVRKYIVSTFKGSSNNSSNSDGQFRERRSMSKHNSIHVTKETELDIECAGISPSESDDQALVGTEATRPSASMSASDVPCIELQETKRFSLREILQRR